MQELLETEIKVLLNMDHPNIVKFHSCVYDNDYINIVMELVKGESLADYLIKKRKLSEQDAKFIMYDICCATKYFHEKGIVHRDLKLLNILLTGTKHEHCDEKEDLRVKVIDFGTAFLKQGEGKIDLSTGCGTIDFMAPEILEGKPYDAKCDMWSIGVIAFFLICGLPPFLGVDDKAIARKIF